MFVIQNMDQKQSNTEVHTNNIRHSTDLHLHFLGYQHVKKEPFKWVVGSLKIFPLKKRHLPIMLKGSKQPSKIFFIVINSTHYRNILT